MMKDRTDSGDRFGLLFDLSSDPMAIIGIRGFRFVEVNPVFTYVLGFTDDELCARSLFDVMHPDDVARVQGKQTGEVLSGTHRYVKKDGGVVWLSLSATPGLGDEMAYVIARDVTEDQQRQQELFRRAHYDVVTGLPNRHLFEDRVQQGLAAAERESRGAALLFLDLDKFKPINDTHGHAIGDCVLKEVAARLLSVVRQTDTVSRYAGDEFVVFLSMLRGPRDAEAVARRIHETIRQPVRLGAFDVSVGVSCGLALFPDDGSDIEKLLTCADERMYAQKLSE